MKTSRIIRLAILSVVFASMTSLAHAQQAPAHVHKALGRLIGEWSCESTVDGKKVKWDLVCMWSPDKKCVTYSWSGTDILTGQPNTGSGILGWDAAKQLVIEQEIDADGSTFTSTHHILDNSEWRSPTKGVSMTNGKPVHIEANRIFEWKSDSEWHVTGTHRIIGGKPAANDRSVCKRK